MDATAELLRNKTGRDVGWLSFTNECDVFTCSQVTRLRYPSIFEWSNDLCRRDELFTESVSEAVALTEPLCCSFMMISLVKVTRLVRHAFEKDAAGFFFVVFGSWSRSRREILADSKYRYCGLTRTLGAGTEDCWNADEGKSVMGLVL